MHTVDGLGWVAGLKVAAYGRRIGVRVNDRRLLRLLPQHLPYGWRPSEGAKVERLYSVYVSRRPRGSHLLFGGAEELARSTECGDILEALERDARLYVAEHARRRIFVHAAVVGWKGLAIVIPGRSMSGKTSLAAEFVRAGANYYSDEYAVLDERGFVHPYGKPLSIRSVEDGYRQTDVPAETLGGRVGSRPLPMGLVLVTQYREGSRWRPRSLSAGMGIMSLLANTIAARKQPEKTLDVLRNAMGTASVWKSVRGEACGVVESVLRFQNSVARCV